MSKAKCIKAINKSENQYKNENKKTIMFKLTL